MKNILMIIGVLVLLVPTLSEAGTYYLRRDENGALIPSTPPGATPAPAAEAAPVPQVAQPTPTAPAPAPTTPVETIQDFAKRYQANCMAKQDPILKGEMQASLCACSAEKLTQSMTVEEVRVMTTETSEGQIMRNKMLVNVYAPCLRYPARALIYDSCITAPDLKAKVPNGEAVCKCMADGMGEYVGVNGPAVIQRSLQINPNDMNPLQSLMNSQEFQSQSQQKLMACLLAPQ